MRTSFKIALVVSGALILVGLLAWILQVRHGLVVTDLQNGFTWGLYIAGLAFFVGNAAGGLVLSSAIYLFGAKHLKPFARLGALIALANVLAAMAIVVPDIGRPERLYNLFLHGNWRSPLVWDVIVLSLYAVLTLVYLRVLMIRNEAVSDRWARILSPFTLLFAVSIHVVTAWIFSTQAARPWWFTPILAPDFVAVAVASGTAFVLLAAVIAHGAAEHLRAAYRSMAAIILGAVLVHLFFMFNDFFIHAWYGAGAELVHWTWGAFPAAHAFEIAAPLLAAVLLMVPAVRRSSAAMGSSATLLIAGVLTHRFLIMPAAMNALPLTLQPLGYPDQAWSMPLASGRYQEGAPTFDTAWSYAPTAVELAIFLAALAFVTLLILVAVRRLPILQRGPS